jgi:hypothetical protein
MDSYESLLAVASKTSETSLASARKDSCVWPRNEKYAASRSWFADVDTAKATIHGNWSLYSKPKANANMLTHPDIKKIILETAREVDPAIIDIRTITQWPKVKIHQIPIEGAVVDTLK